MTAAAAASAQPSAESRLSPAEKRALREQARREFKASEVARLAAAKVPAATSTPAGTPAGTPAATPAAVSTPDPTRTDVDRARDAAAFLRGVLFPVLAVVAPWFGYRLELDELTDAKAAEDARSWVPLLAQYPWLDRVCTWVGAPARLIARVRDIARPREAPPPTKEPAK